MTAMTALPLGCDLAAPALPLRPYQRDALAAIEAAAGRGVSRQLVVLPTGAGKTVCFASMVSQRPGRALVLAHRDELISQAAAKLALVGGSLDIGVVKAHRDDHGSRVVVASVQTLASEARLSRVGKFATVIVDEAHHAVADTYRAILTGLGCMDPGGPLTVGFTATASRSDKVGLGAVWEEITYQRGIVQMIAEGYLCDVKALQVTAGFDIGNVAVKAGDYTDASIGAELERSDTITVAAQAYVTHARDRLGVAFTPTIATAHALAGELTAKGVRAEAVDGTMPLEQRRAILRRLHRGETRVVPNAQVLVEGWDEPAVSCALMLRPTKSVSSFVQMAGRVLRPFVGKDDALILDVCGATGLGLASIADLAGLPPGAVKPGKSLLDAAEEHVQAESRKVAVAAVRARQVDLLRRSPLRWLEVEGAWVLPAGESQVMILIPAGEEAWDVYRQAKGCAPFRESGKPLTLDWARGVGEEVARAQGGALSRSDAPWRQRPASERQVEVLRSAGWDGEPGGITRGEASDLITARSAGRAVRKLIKAGAR